MGVSEGGLQFVLNCNNVIIIITMVRNLLPVRVDVAVCGAVVVTVIVVLPQSVDGAPTTTTTQRHLSTGLNTTPTSSVDPPTISEGFRPRTAPVTRRPRHRS